jgi:hypothetical protein
VLCLDYSQDCYCCVGTGKQPIFASAKAPTVFHSFSTVHPPPFTMLLVRSLAPRAQATSGSASHSGAHRRPAQRAPPPSALSFVQPTSLSNSSSSNYSSGSLETAPSCPWPQPGTHMPQPAQPKGVWASLFGGFQVRCRRIAQESWLAGGWPPPTSQRANCRFTTGRTGELRSTS